MTIPDMLSLVTRYPEWLGIGIDEGTALVVKEDVGEVVRRSSVYFYDASKGVAEEFEPIQVSDGEFYHLRRRVPIDPPAASETEQSEKLKASKPAESAKPAQTAKP
ncbi:MAG: hypothetical protein HUJ26_06490 [Planctomycetaceae bacterium]|nr:hypothetical protein [Planctomycetaceae bacterium]